MREIQEKIRKSEKGSVTLFVLVSMMFTTMFLLFAYTSQTNRISDQKKQIAEIQRKYNTGNMEDIYNQMQTKEPQNGEIILRKANGEIYSIKDWTNEDLTLEIPYPDEIQDKYYYLDGEKINYQEGQKITKNCTIEVAYENYRAEVQVSKIDKVLPTVELGINGGTGYTMPSSGNATIKTTITANDLGGSKLATLQYAWSNSNTTEPSAWKDFTNGSEVIKTDITLAGNYYLWTKVMDGAGNRAETVKTSNAFVVSANTITENKIVLTPNPSTWTNSTVTVTANYGVNLTENRTITCTGTETIDYTRNGNDSVTVNTNGQTVTATATDIAGNKVIKTLTIENIDITKPTVNVEAQDITSDSAKLVVTATDTGSGIPLEKAYSYYLDGNLKATVDSAEYTYTGLPSGTECVLKVVVVDKAGNDAEATTTITTELAQTKNLVEEKNKKTVFTTKTELEDVYQNKLFVPEGFKIADESATDVTGGVVIEDATGGVTAGSQFVWIPIGNAIYTNESKTESKPSIALKRYAFNTNGTINTSLTKLGPSDQWKPTTGSAYYFIDPPANTTDTRRAKDIVAFINSVKGNGGYYFARYEARTTGTTARTSSSTATVGTMTVKGSNSVYNYIKQADAATISQGMYNNENATFTSDLVNSYAWNTAVVFLQECSGDSDYSKQISLNTTFQLKGTNNSTTTTTQDKRCNIWDMASNCNEWTTENAVSTTSTTGKKYATSIGGVYYGQNKTVDTTMSHRIQTSGTGAFVYRTFRPILYFTK